MQQADLRQLIEKASVEAGSQKALAALVGCSATRLTDWKTGVVRCPPEKVALIAWQAKMPADQWLTEAVLWRHEGTPEGARLQTALKKQHGGGGVALRRGVVEAAHIPRCVLSKTIGRGKGIAIKLRLHREALRA